MCSGLVVVARVHLLRKSMEISTANANKEKELSEEATTSVIMRESEFSCEPEPHINTGKELIVYCPPGLPSCEGISHKRELNWNADWAWSVAMELYKHMHYTSFFFRTSRLNHLLVKSARLKVVLAWSSTLGGAHSALGDTFTAHVSI